MYVVHDTNTVIPLTNNKNKSMILFFIAFRYLLNIKINNLIIYKHFYLEI